MLFSADFYPTQEEAIAQLGQYFQSPEEDDVDESGILQVLHKVELKEADSEYLQARTANIMAVSYTHLTLPTNREVEILVVGVL